MTDWKHELIGAVDLSGEFARQDYEKETARNALIEAFKDDVSFGTYIQEVEAAIEKRVRAEAPTISIERLKALKSKARRDAMKIKTYFKSFGSK